MEEKRVVIVNKNVASYISRNDSCVFFTGSSGEAAEKLLAIQPEIVEFVGGDGTFSATLNDVLFNDPGFLKDRKIIIQPKGSGNDRIKALMEINKRVHHSGVSSKEGLKSTSGSTIIRDDYLLATINGSIKRYIFNIGGIGLDSQTLLEYEARRELKVPPSLKYFGAATAAIHRLNGYKGLVNYSAGKAINQSAEPVMFLFMLGKYFGGGMPINGRLAHDDGQFEAVILNRGTNLKLYSSLVAISLLKQSQYTNPIVNYLDPVSSAELKILSTDKFYFESDGEVLMDGKKPLEIKEITVEVAGKISYLME
jgi:diacylglycerol kinase family enzyme